MSMRLFVSDGRNRLVAVLALSVLAGGLILATTARAQDCDEDLARAQQDINRGRFAQAIVTLRQCLDNNQPDEETQAKAYRLIGVAYVGDQKEAEAKEAIVRLLEVAPEYEPDPNEYKNFVALYNQVRREQDPSYKPPSGEPEQKKGFFRKAIYGIGAAAVAVVAIVVGGGGDDNPSSSDELPDPPTLPR